MYRSFYKLSAKPFQISTDPRFLWLGPKHKEAIATLKYGVQQSKGFILLTGDVGTGKTTLVHALINLLPEDVVVATLPDPGLSREEFFHLVSRNFKLSETVSSKENFSDTFEDFLEQLAHERKTALLVIDEAQIMTSGLLEEVRLLINLGVDHKKGLTVLLVGQNELHTILTRPEARALESRVTISYHLNPLKLEETTAYINHRLRVAGTSEEIFTPAAIGRIHAFSQGFPRHINILCDLSLLFGFEEGKQQVDEDIIEACEKRIRIPSKPPDPEPVPGEAPIAAIDPYALQTARSPRRWHQNVLGVITAMVVVVAGYFYFDQHARSRLITRLQPIKQAVVTKLFQSPHQQQAQETAATSPTLLPPKPRPESEREAVAPKHTDPSQAVAVSQPPPPQARASDEDTQILSHEAEPAANPAPTELTLSITGQTPRSASSLPEPEVAAAPQERNAGSTLTALEPESIVEDVASALQDPGEQLPPSVSYASETPQNVAEIQDMPVGSGDAATREGDGTPVVGHGTQPVPQVTSEPSKVKLHQLVHRENASALPIDIAPKPATPSKDAEQERPSSDTVGQSASVETAERAEDAPINPDTPDPADIIDWLIKESQKPTP
jgi:type II secretory pathway predicted ATPase ExeA